MGKKTNREIILSARPNKPTTIELSSINLASFRQEAYELNNELKMRGISLPKGRKTFYEVNVVSRENKVVITNHMNN